MTDTLRLFYALAPDVDSRGRLAKAAHALDLVAPAEPVPQERYHLTIAFVGEVPAAALVPLTAIGAAMRAAPFILRFDAYEYWPKPEVIVAVARQVPPDLKALWDDLHAELARAGHTLRIKSLRPHVTLAHHVRPAPTLPPFSQFSWTVPDYCLMGSARDVNGRAYTVLGTWPLLDKNDAV